jgi:flagellar protein FlaG
MGIPIGIMGGGNARVLGETQDKKSQARSTQAKAASLARFTASLPGNGPRNKNVEAAIAQLEKVSLAFNKRLQFVVNHESNQVTVKVIDGNTDKVIKVLPPAELQRLADVNVEMIGSLLDEQI